MTHRIGLLRGDGIGPEICDAVIELFKKMKAPVEWVDLVCGDVAIKNHNSAIPPATIDEIRKLGVALKGPTGTPIGTGHKSANVTLRKSLDLFANVRPALSLAGLKTAFSNIDIIIVRENTEDVYAAIEHQIAPGVMQCLKIITRTGCERLIRHAFEMAINLKRKKITCVHKANIMKMTDGLFLDVFRETAKNYPGIEANDIIVDNVCMQLVQRPQQFDVLVTENLYGDILSDLSAGLIGGLGVAGGANIGKDVAVFEAVHGTAPDIAGKGLANPTALILSSVMMLEHLKLFEFANRLKSALLKTIEEGKTLTGDLKGRATTQEFTAAIARRL